MAYTFAGEYGGQQITNTSGVPLAGASVSVYPHGSSALASLYTDRTMATAAANPVTTDGEGNLTFFAAPGQYDLLPAGFANKVTVAVPVDPGELAADYLPLSGAAAAVVSTPVTFDALSASSAQTSAPLGPELTGTVWTFTGTAVASGNGGQFAAGGGTMTQSLTGIVAGTWYQVVWTQTGVSAGNLDVQIGTASRDNGSTPFYWPNGTTARVIANASGVLPLTFTGDGTYNGAVTSVSVKAITGFSVPQAVLVDAAATVLGQLRADTLSNVGVGQSSLQSNTTGSSNVGVGQSSLQSNTTGVSNVGVGQSSLYSPNGNGAFATTTASGQTALGFQTGQASTTQANYITAVGYQATVGAPGGVALGADHTGTGATTSVQDQIALGTALHQVLMSGTVKMTGLPTADPHIVGELWANAGIVTVSAG